jgi:hypothetical protein
MRLLVPALLALCACASTPPAAILVIESPDFG